MSEFLLSKEEKERFSKWLRLQEFSTKGIIEQMEKMNLHEGFIEQHKIEALSFKVVADIIDSGENMSIGDD